MPKITLGNKAYAGIKAADGRYVGDTPPVGAYVTVTGKTWKVKKTKNDDTMLTVPLTVKYPKGHKKARYNGYTIWHNLVLGETSIPFVNAFLDAIGIDPKAFHGAAAKTDPQGRVVGIAGIDKIGGLSVLVATRHKVWKGKKDLEATAFAPYDESALVESEDDDDDFEADEAEESAADDDGDDEF